MGEDVARCPSCSLHLHVVFDPGELGEKRWFLFFLRPLEVFFAHLFFFSKPPPTTTADFAAFLPGASKQPSSEGGASKAVSVA